MWTSIEAALRAYALSDDSKIWVDPIVTLFKKNNIRPGVWVIVDNKKFTYEANQKHDGYIIHMKDYSDG